MKTCWGWMAVALLLGSCGRETAFLYRLTDTPVRNIESVHKLKELQGENKVDILWVIDNSASMGIFQQKLITNADTFITDFVAKGGLEWKMGILSTDLNEKPYIGFTASTQLNHRTVDGIQAFKAAVGRLGTNGDAYERTFAPIEKNLTDYPDFLRKNAILAVIMVTDAQEQSRIPASKMVSFLESLKGDIRRVVTYGVFGAEDFGCPKSGEYLIYAGSPYEDFIKATSGITYKLCGDFGQNLADLGKDLVQRVKRPYIQLPERPLEASLRVIYKGKDLPGGPLDSGGMWVYDFNQNRVVFHSLDFAPGDQEEVTVAYDRPVLTTQKGLR